MQPNASPRAFLGALTETIDQVVFAYGVDAAQFIYLNPAFETVFGQNRETLDPRALLASVHAEDQEYISEAYQDLLGGKPASRWSFACCCPTARNGGCG